MAIFPGEHGFIEPKDDGSGGDNWSHKTCKTPVMSSPPTNQHPTFYRLDALPIVQPSVKALKEKYHIPRTCSPQAHPGESSNFVFDHKGLRVTLCEGCHASHQPSDANTTNNK